MDEIRTTHEFHQACVSILNRRFRLIRSHCATVRHWLDGIEGCTIETRDVLVSTPISELMALIEHASVIREVEQLRKSIGVSHVENKKTSKGTRT